jgi:hypothetical protein
MLGQSVCTASWEVRHEQSEMNDVSHPSLSICLPVSVSHSGLSAWALKNLFLDQPKPERWPPCMRS